MIKGPSTTHERVWDCSAWTKGGSGQNLSMSVGTDLKGGCKEDEARLFTGAQCQDKSQLAQTEKQNAPPEHQEARLYCVDSGALAQAAHRGCGGSLLGQLQKLPGCGLEDPAVGGSAWAGRLDQMTSRGPFQPQPFCDSVLQTVG